MFKTHLLSFVLLLFLSTSVFSGHKMKDDDLELAIDDPKKRKLALSNFDASSIKSLLCNPLVLINFCVLSFSQMLKLSSRNRCLLLSL